MTDNLAGIYGRISLVRNLCWDICAGIYGRISVVGYLGIEMINVGSTTESDLSGALRLSERVWHSGQFVRLNRILFHTVDSQLLLMLIITRSLADHLPSSIFQTTCIIWQICTLDLCGTVSTMVTSDHASTQVQCFNPPQFNCSAILPICKGQRFLMNNMGK